MAYIPTKDSDLVSWGANITTLLTGDPARYGVTAAQALNVQNEFDDFDAAYAAAVDPTTRSPTTVAHKNGTKALFLFDIRNLAAIIRSNLGVSDADKTALGLNIPDPVPTPVPTPTTVPVLSVLGANSSQHTLVYHDELTPHTKAKPFGVIGALVFRSIKTTPQTNFDLADPVLIADATKSPFTVEIPAGNGGKFATYWAQWFTRTGKLGPLSAPQAFVCPGAPPTP